MSRLQLRASGDAGETLAELLVTISIIGISIVLLVGALGNSIALSSTHRQFATGETVARNVAEALKDRNSVPAWDSNGNYPASTWGSVDTTGFNPPVVSVECWKNGATPATFDTCPAGDLGLQRITVTVTSKSKGEKETLQILKRKT